MKQYRHIAYILLTLLLLGSIANKAWAQTEVTYHILALPMDHTKGTKNTKTEYDGYRVEAVKVVTTSSTIVLPPHFKSPLAKNFTYYASNFITKGSVVAIYQNQSGTKYQLYTAPKAPYIKVTKDGASITEEASTKEAWEAHSGGTQQTATSAADYTTKKAALEDGICYFKMTTLGEGDPVGENKDIYVTYEYDPDNTVAKLDGSVAYNICMYSGTNASKKGFLALNRGRNNRVTIVPTSKVSSSDLISDDFVYIDLSDTDMKTYWQSGDNWNEKSVTGSNFHFLFKYIGEDPYNITICTAYDKDKYYIEKFANDDGQVNKYYKESSVYFAPTTNNPELFITSDVDRKYKTVNSSKTSLTPGVTWEDKLGWYRQLQAPIWNSFAILDVKYIDPNKTGHVFLATRTHNANGTFNGPTKDGNNYKYNYMQADYNAMKIVAQTSSTAVSKYTVDDEIYVLDNVNFKVRTQFGNDITAPILLSKYSIEHEEIKIGDIPAKLDRKYINYTGKFYKDAALTQEITSYINAYDEDTHNYNVYIGYEVSGSAPKFIKPADSYDAETWRAATWYEMTDGNSNQASGKKLKYVDTKFKNSGADGDYEKTSEFAFIGDPYELQVVYRNATSGATPYYVGAAGTPPATGTELTANTTASAGFVWDMPDDETVGSFLLRRFNDENQGHWYWLEDNTNITYGADPTFNESYNSHTLTFTISGLNGNKYFKVTKGGTDAAQITSTTPATVVAETGTTATVTVTLSAADADKEMTVTIQEYNDAEGSTPSDANPTVITIHQKNTDDAVLAVQYSTSSKTRIKTMELPKRNFTYNIVDVAGEIAVQATIEQTIFSPLNGYASIPADIRSPFLADETISYYSAYSGEGRGNLLPADIIDETSNADANIFVSYTNSHLSTKSIKLNNEQQFNVKLNEEYIYYDTSAGKILSSSTIPGTEEAAKYYLWRLEGADPYSMKIYNLGKEQYVKVASWTNEQTLGFDATIGNASRFIAMLSVYQGIYEVLAATGTTAYYRIGRPTGVGYETKMYTYAHGADELRFELSGQDPVRYILIDKAGKELLEVSSNNPRLTLPAEFVSPLVDNYYYFPTEALALDDVTNGNHSGNITEPVGITDEGKKVWVTYTVNDRVKFNDDNSPYMLKFWNGGSYKMEDGNDRLTSTTIKAMYPYTNGDGNLNVYGQAMNEEQMNGGSSTRSRWVWFFDSDNNDPYHVKIHSSNTITYKDIKHPTYLQTYAVHYNQDDAGKQRIVTGGALPGIASTDPTEYMILGTEGKFKLLTTNAIPVDLDGDGYTTGTRENVRQYVNSFEQYWKTYNMIKLHVLGIEKSTDEFSNDESTWVVPAGKRTELNAKLATLEIGSGNWHSYDAIANAVRWNGYNDKTDGHEKKVVERLEHWYQTFDMGDGTFDIESASIPPVLVLLDRHGWEIMRKPLPKYETYPYGDELTALKAYDSPMVKEYKFYNNATKGTGCHKYVLRMQNGAERDQIKKSNGEQYTSFSLAALPPRTASGVIVGGAIQDLYVTYTVKEEYENSYKYHLELHEEDSTYTESGTASKFLILQNGRFARDNNGAEGYLSKPIFESSNPSGGNIFDAILSPSNRQEDDVNTNVDENTDGKFDDINLWYLQPNLNIDKEMGIKWAEVKNASLEPHTEYEMKKEYKDKTGFDPYNIQLKNAGNNKYMTSHMTTTTLTGGAMVGDYTGEGGSKYITLETWFDVKNADTTTPKKINDVIVNEGYDHTYIQMTNQTFMAVSDANGNMQLMPRFDHTQRINVTAGRNSRTTLADPVDYVDYDGEAKVDDNSAMGPQTTFFVRPQVFEYHILDNDGQEALRYKTSGEYFPSITEHFKSPLATNYKFYYDHAASTTSTSNKESYTAAVASDYFKKTVDSEDDMGTTAKLLTVLDDYYFKIGTAAPYTYKKVTVTKGYVAGSPATDATYTTTDCKQTDWENAVASQSYYVCNRKSYH